MRSAGSWWCGIGEGSWATESREWGIFANSKWITRQFWLVWPAPESAVSVSYLSEIHSSGNFLLCGWHLDLQLPSAAPLMGPPKRLPPLERFNLPFAEEPGSLAGWPRALWASFCSMLYAFHSGISISQCPPCRWRSRAWRCDKEAYLLLLSCNLPCIYSICFDKLTAISFY